MLRAAPLLCVLAASLATPAPAERGLARNGLAVAGDARGFEVFARAGIGGPDYFCAAGDFARTHLNARATDRVEIAGPLGPSATQAHRRSVVFVLRPAGTGRNSGLDVLLLRPRAEGTSRSVAHAAHLCATLERRGGGEE
jgi:hypothetical protein